MCAQPSGDLDEQLLGGGRIGHPVRSQPPQDHSVWLYLVVVAAQQPEVATPDAVESFPRNPAQGAVDPSVQSWVCGQALHIAELVDPVLDEDAGIAQSSSGLRDTVPSRRSLAVPSRGDQSVLVREVLQEPRQRVDAFLGGLAQQRALRLWLENSSDDRHHHRVVPSTDAPDGIEHACGQARPTLTLGPWPQGGDPVGYPVDEVGRRLVQRR